MYLRRVSLSREFLKETYLCDGFVVERCPVPEGELAFVIASE